MIHSGFNCSKLEITVKRRYETNSMRANGALSVLCTSLLYLLREYTRLCTQASSLHGFRAKHRSLCAFFSRFYTLLTSVNARRTHTHTHIDPYVFAHILCVLVRCSRSENTSQSVFSSLQYTQRLLLQYVYISRLLLLSVLVLRFST